MSCTMPFAVLMPSRMMLQCFAAGFRNESLCVENCCWHERMDPEELQRRRSPFLESLETSFQFITESTFLVPELCIFHPLTRRAHAIAKHVPRILWWLHLLLNAQELRKHLLPQPVGDRCAQPQAV